MKTQLKKWAKRLIATIFILALLGIVSLLSINSYVKHSVVSRILTAEDTAHFDEMDCILILGCSIRNDTPSPMLSDRLDQGISLYELDASDKLLMSGDHGKPFYDEVTVMKQYAIDAGVPSEDVFMDHAGFSTYESMYRARDVFCAKKILIVTQEYHLYRALYVANSLGLDAYGIAATPNSYAGQTYRDFREVLARNKDFFYVLFSVMPSYLGETIPVSGNGNLTND